MKQNKFFLPQLLMVAICLSYGIARAQLPPDKLDVVGLKLGMTMADAKATLLNYNKDIKLTVGSLSFYNRRIDLSTKIRPQLGTVDGGSAESPPGKEFVPVELDGSLLTHVYGLNGMEITDKTSSDPVYDISGEFFTLYFTPTEEGDRLYAIGRSVRDARINETNSQLIKRFTDKYGQPSLSSSSSPQWMYDVRSRFLHGNNKEFRRCDIFLKEPQPSQNGAGGFGFSARDYYTYPGPASGLVGDFGLTFRMNDSATNIRQCGTQFDLRIANSTGDHVVGFYERLFDISAAYFDDGSESYLRKKAIELNGPASASAPPKL